MRVKKQCFHLFGNIAFVNFLLITLILYLYILCTVCDYKCCLGDFYTIQILLSIHHTKILYLALIHFVFLHQAHIRNRRSKNNLFAEYLAKIISLRNIFRHAYKFNFSACHFVAKLNPFFYCNGFFVSNIKNMITWVLFYYYLNKFTKV